MPEEELCECGTPLDEDAFLGDSSTGICTKCAEKKVKLTRKHIS